MSTRTPNEVRELGLAVLAKALGPADTVRFLQQYDRGNGDYSAERERLLSDPSVQDLVKAIDQRRRAR